MKVRLALNLYTRPINLKQTKTKDKKYDKR